jgi:hypothetical protein
LRWGTSEGSLPNCKRPVERFLVMRAGMKRISVIATVDWAQIILRCLVLAEGGFAVRAQAPNNRGLHKLLTIDAALHSISRTVKRFLPDVVIPGVAGLIKTSLCASTTGCWFRQQRCLR